MNIQLVYPKATITLPPWAKLSPTGEDTVLPAMLEDIAFALGVPELDYTLRKSRLGKSYVLKVRGAAQLPDPGTPWEPPDELEERILDAVPLALSAFGAHMWPLDGQTPHLFLPESTGFGKTVCIYCLVLTTTSLGHTCSVVDSEHSGDYSWLRAHPGIDVHDATYPQMAKAVREAHELVETRLTTRWMEQTAGHMFTRPRRHFLIIDGISALRRGVADTGKKGEEQQLMSHVAGIAEKARKVGVHLVVASQYAHVTEQALLGHIQTNLKYRLTGLCSVTDAMQKWGNGQAARQGVVLPGRGFAGAYGEAAPARVQVPFVCNPLDPKFSEVQREAAWWSLSESVRRYEALSIGAPQGASEGEGRGADEASQAADQHGSTTERDGAVLELGASGAQTPSASPGTDQGSTHSEGRQAG